MIKKIIKDKRMLALYIIVFLALFLGFTYALGDASSLAINVETALIGVDEAAYGVTNINTSNIDFKPIIDTEVTTNTDNIVKIEFSVGGASTNELTDVIYDIALVDLALDCELISPYIKWRLVKDGTELSSGTLEKGIKNRRLVLTEEQEDLPVYNTSREGYHSYTFYMWFSDSCQNEDLSTCFGKIDQSELVGKKFRGKIEVELYTESKVGYGLIENREVSDNSACIGNNSYLDFDANDYTSINKIPNVPNLDNGSLIPVYYDETGSYTYTVTDPDTGTEIEKEVVGVWKKADSANLNNSWYNYIEKKWANAVVISESATTDYSTSDINTIVKESDIDAFYVWIPRFKYKVWNITRQGGSTSTYAYNAFSYGIQISFEEGTTSTGNVRCEYNVRNSTPATTLSDACYYNDLGVFKPTDNNKDYTAWYTHPAFNFGGIEKTGFWIGKFETSGSADAPQILPDKVALTNQNVSTQFATSKKFQSRFTNLDAHMLTNLEWGAVSYLSYSLYGTCDYVDEDVVENTYCTSVNQNNSNSMYTGRSGGAPSNSELLTLNNVYGTGGTAKYNNYGYYNYKGYKLDSTTGEPTISKYINKVSSTTKNPTGVYDMSGGAWDYVMGNQVNSSYNFHASSSGTSWNGSATLDTKYYNAYSYGITYNDQTAFNRARLGDATAEVLGGINSIGVWNSSITGTNSNFFNSGNSWLYRGGFSTGTNAGIFGFERNNGTTNSSITFRSSLS